MNVMGLIGQLGDERKAITTVTVGVVEVIVWLIPVERAVVRRLAENPR
jgi:hypothetical protein